ncbi:MAG: translation elongation factor Ts [Bacilli bacterium]
MFTASNVKELRDKTGAGMLDCKKALVENNGDMDLAIDWLREKGISKAAKKESRIAAEGITEIVIKDNCAVILEINCETDFVAKNPEFKSFANLLANTIIDNDLNSVSEVLDFSVDGNKLNDVLVALIAKIGEKLSFRRFTKLNILDNQIFGMYSHMGGRIGVLTILEGNNVDVAKDIAMHIAAINPRYINISDVDSEVLEKEKHIIKEQAINEGKPKEIAEKMVIGRINKFYKEICLYEQEFVKNPDITVKEYLKQNNMNIVSMVRYEVGEGIEKRVDDFASEVMNQVKGN